MSEIHTASTYARKWAKRIAESVGRAALRTWTDKDIEAYLMELGIEHHEEQAILNAIRQEQRGDAAPGDTPRRRGMYR